MILREFGLYSDMSHIINGHTPVKTIEGEQPIRANGKLMVIDGGFCKNYHETTGIAGYTLIYNSHGLRLKAHQPFESVYHALLDKFESKVKPGGTLIYDPSGIHRLPSRTDIRVIPVDAITASIELKNSKTYNMVLLGALLKCRPIVGIDAVIRGLRKTLPERHHHLIPLNEEALRKGMSLVD